MKRRTLLQAGAGVLMAAQAEMSMARARESSTTKNRRQELYGLLGKLPPRHRKVSAKTVSTEDRGSYTLEKLVLDLNGEEPVPAYFASPSGASGKLPPSSSIIPMAAATPSARRNSSRAASTWASRPTRNS